MSKNNLDKVQKFDHGSLAGLQNNLPMWTRDRNDYSPLRLLRTNEQLSINNTPYYGDGRDASSNRRIYEEIKDRLHNGSDIEKQLLDIYANRLSKKQLNKGVFDRLEIYKDHKEHTEKDPKGGYHKAKNLGDKNYSHINVNAIDRKSSFGNKNPTSLINILNHEFDHAAGDLDNDSRQYVEDIFKNQNNYPNGENNYFDFISDLQSLADPTEGFNTQSYKPNNMFPKNKSDWHPDEFNTHQIQNIGNNDFSNIVLAQENPDPKTFSIIKSLLNKKKEIFSGADYGNDSSDNYPDVLPGIDAKIKAVQQLQQAINNRGSNHSSFFLQNQLPQQPSYQAQQQQLGYIEPQIQRPSAFLDKIRAQINPDKQKGYFNQPKQNPGFEQRQQHFQPSNQFSQFEQQAAQQQNKYYQQKGENDLEARLAALKNNQEYVPYQSESDQEYATGGSVSRDYDPYLNTYNYGPPLSPAEYMDNQMPDARYEGGVYGDPDMSYSNAYDNDGQQYSFKEGGSVKEEDLPRLADLIRRHGRNGDTELAHINPIEAHILKSLGGSGTINPATGLREYGFFKNPFKAIKSVLGGGAGAIIGNMIAPGIGGIIGGAIGQGAQHAARGKSALGGALKGAGMGAALPSVASGLGWGASKLGATALGSSLSNYGSTNAILPALGLGTSGGSSGLFGLGGSNPYVSGGLSAATALSSGMGGGVPPQYGQYPQMQYPGYPYVDNRGFLEKFGDNAKDYLTQPGNLLTLGTVAAQYAGRQKPKSPEKIAEEERRYRNASRKTIAEVEADEALETARADLQKKRKNKQLDEDIKNMGRINRRVVSPEEFARTGRWLEYTDEDGRPLRMKGGGSAHSPYAYLMEETYYPASPIGYLSGDSGGQDDLIDAKLSDGEYVFDASTVSDLGDGNNAAGARKLDVFRENIRKHKRGGKVNLPPRSKSLESYLRG